MTVITDVPSEGPIEQQAGPKTLIRPPWLAWFKQVFLCAFSVQHSGTTAQRPTKELWVGRRYFDTTLDQPVWYDGTTWVTWPVSVGNGFPNIKFASGGSITLTTADNGAFYYINNTNAASFTFNMTSSSNPATPFVAYFHLENACSSLSFVFPAVGYQFFDQSGSGPATQTVTGGFQFGTSFMVSYTSDSPAGGSAGPVCTIQTLANDLFGYRSELMFSSTLNAIRLSGTTAATASAGTSGALPAQVAGYLVGSIQGTGGTPVTIKIPIYLA